MLRSFTRVARPSRSQTAIIRSWRSVGSRSSSTTTSNEEASTTQKQPPAALDPRDPSYPSGGALLAHRFTQTAEVTVSKIFPAGFGWQSSSLFAEHIGYGDPTSVPFFLITGGGDFAGVFAGHCGYYLMKKALVDKTIDATSTVTTGWWLASAAFCSGAMWQPTVNVLQGAALSFNAVFLGTWAVCGAAFYGGLRLGRIVYPFVDEGTYENLKNDASLSLSIGGATAFFVGTDAAYASGAGNWLIDVVGVHDVDSDIVGCVKAGSSTALGFMAAQAAENVTYTKGKLWLDP